VAVPVAVGAAVRPQDPNAKTRPHLTQAEPVPRPGSQAAV
jgi:hypothetical protein